MIFRTRRFATAAVIAAGLLPLTSAAQRPTFAPTLYWESGLINAPAAYVAPLGGDISFSMSRLNLGTAAGSTASSEGASHTVTVAGSLWGRAELGISVFSGDLSSGLFGKVMVYDQTDGIWRRGLRHWLPSLAVGVRNIGGEVNLNRFAMTGATRVTEAPSVYGVATRTTVLKAADATDLTRPKVQLSTTVGVGRGIFAEGGGQGDAYAPSGTNGLFAGGSLDFAIGRYSSLSLIAEHDAWAINAGVRLETQGFRFSLFGVDVNGNSGENGDRPFTAPKLAMAFSWQAHALTLLRGNKLEERTARMESQQGDLERQVQLAQQRIDALQTQINALRAVAEQQRTAERADLERRLKEEQEALQRLQDLIRSRATRPPPDGGAR